MPKMFALKMYKLSKLHILSLRNVETISRNTQIPKIRSLIFKLPCSSIYFRLYSVSVLLSECNEWPVAPISACLRLVPHGCFGSECCTGGESMAAPRVNCSLAPTQLCRARGWTGRKYRFSSFRHDLTVATFNFLR